MSFEWLTLEIPLDHAKEIKYNYRENYERTFTSGPAKGGHLPEDTYYYTSYLHFENIPQWLKTCYIKGAYIDHKQDNVTTTVGDYYYDTEGKLELLHKNVVNLPYETYVLTGSEEEISNNLILSDGSGAFRDTTEKTLQKILQNGNIIEKIDYTRKKNGDIEIYWFNEFEDVSQIVLKIVYSKAPVDVTPIYPVDVYFKKTKPLEISWSSRIEIYKEPSYESLLYTKSNEILYIEGTTVEVWNDAGTRKEYTLSGDASVYQISLSDLSDFSVGNLYYKITSKTNDNVEGYTTSKCILVGETNAPTITGHTSNSFPTISWECENQSAWQMIIKQGETVFLETGIKTGSEQEYKVPILLDDGNYSVEMRVVNTVGVYTGWSSYFMALVTNKPSAPSGIIVSSNNKYGITVKCITPEDAGTLYVMKRKDSLSRAEIVGEYKDNFVDYNVALNEYYEYTVKNYVEGSADGEWIDAIVSFNGIIVRKENDFVRVYMSETDFDVINSDEKTNTLTRCVGRTYPVLEIGEWITSTRKVSACVSNDEYNTLINMALNNNVILQNNKEVIPCYMHVVDGGKHVSGNRLVELTFTRIDGE